MGAIEVAKREHHQAVLDAHAAHLRSEGYTFRQIADAMDCSVGVAHDRVNRAYGRMPGPNALTERNRQLRELDDMKVSVYAVLEAQHVTITAKGVATITVEVDGQRREIPVPDDHPVLEAVDRLLKIQERRARLLGTDAPSRRSVEVVTKDALVTAMEQLNAQMAEAEEFADDAQGGAG